MGGVAANPGRQGAPSPRQGSAPDGPAAVIRWLGTHGRTRAFQRFLLRGLPCGVTAPRPALPAVHSGVAVWGGDRRRGLRRGTPSTAPSQLRRPASAHPGCLCWCQRSQQPLNPAGAAPWYRSGPWLGTEPSLALRPKPLSSSQHLLGGLPAAPPQPHRACAHLGRECPWGSRHGCPVSRCLQGISRQLAAGGAGAA